MSRFQQATCCTGCTREGRKGTGNDSSFSSAMTKEKLGQAVKHRHLNSKKDMSDKSLFR